MNRPNLILPILLLLAVTAGCSNEAPPPAAVEPAPTTGGGAAGDAPPPGAADPALAPITTHGGRPPAGIPVESSEIVAPGAVFTVPEGWQQQQPRSRMRLAQAVIPGSAGPAELTVFFFGVGGGGGVESNLQRWIGQVDPDPGTAATSGAFTVGQFQVTSVEVRGTLKPSNMGTGPTTPQPGSMLLGAVVEGPGGPWFFKATGPAATLDAERDAFFAMLKSARSQA